MYPVGYERIRVECGLEDVLHYCSSFILESGSRRTVQQDGKVEEYYTKSYDPGESILNHLVFALKYEGLNPYIIERSLKKIDRKELALFIQQTPTGKQHRRLWYLYESLTGERLDIPDLTKGNYVDLIDEKKFFTSEGVKIQRQRINNNLLGDLSFCPMVRRTKKIEDYLDADFGSRCARILEEYPADLLHAALSHFYTQETRSSFLIEQESLSGNKQERFMQMLREADSEDYLCKPALVDLQKKVITDSRFHRDGYRDTQEYVGSSSLTGDIVHLVPPKPEDLDELMEGLFRCAHRMIESEVHPVIIAAIAAFGFVYIHPFKDGNGRIHRFLIHHVLARQGFTPKNFLFPISAVMYQNASRYQETLNLFSQPLLQQVDYVLDHEGFMTVRGDTINLYRYIDATGIVENLFAFIEETINTEFLKELAFLRQFAEARDAVELIVDGLPLRETRLFIKNCRENNFKLSKTKRDKFFSQLTDDEIYQMERAVKAAFEE